MTMRDDVDTGPVQQSLGVAMWVFRLALLVAALGWACANIHPVPPGSQAVVLAFGAVARAQQAGLVVAAPRPFEHVVLMPSGERRMILPFSTPTKDGEMLLTGDGGLVVLAGELTWHISDAAVYYVTQVHVPAALHRICRDAAIRVAARHDLDDFLAARPERARDAHGQAARAAIRGEIVDAMNGILAALVATHDGLGVEILRADLTASLPADARGAFDAVLEAGQRADQGIAVARTDAARILQQADRDRDRILANAQASSAERVAQARANTATISALEAQDASARPGLLADLYRDRIAVVLSKADSVSAVDSRSLGRFILPGAGP
jgi:regulator of protease activity HflC (stomatin/prohibitin superfamily)